MSRGTESLVREIGLPPKQKNRKKEKKSNGGVTICVPSLPSPSRPLAGKYRLINRPVWKKKDFSQPKCRVFQKFYDFPLFVLFLLTTSLYRRCWNKFLPNRSILFCRRVGVQFTPKWIIPDQKLAQLILGVDWKWLGVKSNFIKITPLTHPPFTRRPPKP